MQKHIVIYFHVLYSDGANQKLQFIVLFVRFVFPFYVTVSHLIKNNIYVEFLLN